MGKENQRVLPERGKIKSNISCVNNKEVRVALYTLIPLETKHKLKLLQQKYGASESWIINELVKNVII